MLAFDTATSAVAVAVHDGHRVVAETVTVDARRHGELLAPSIAKVLVDAGATRSDVAAIAVGVGPGPYTGLRVGVVTARVLGAALGVPVHGMCTLDVIATDALPAAAGREFLVATGARRKELYWAAYDGSGRRLTGPAVDRPAQLPTGLPVAGGNAAAIDEAVARAGAPERDAPPAGNGVPAPDRGGSGDARQPIEAACEPIEPCFPSAGTLAGMVAAHLAGRPIAVLDPEPLYLRRPDASVPGAPKRVTAP